MSGRDNIILLGPLATGKSLIAQHLSMVTGRSNHPVDKLKWYYRHKNGYDLATSTNILRNQGFEALINYAQRYFGTNDLKHLLHKFKGIIDLGASDTHCSDHAKFNELAKVFYPYQNVFLLLPSKDHSESIDILSQRLVKRYEHDELKRPVIDSYLKMNEMFIRSESTRMLAKHIVYTKGRPIHGIVDEIVQKCCLNSYHKLYKVS